MRTSLQMDAETPVTWRVLTHSAHRRPGTGLKGFTQKC